RRVFMSINRSMPPGVIIPELPYQNVPEAADWLCQAFGFKKRLQIADHRFQLIFGNSSVVVIEDQYAKGSWAILVHIEDADSHYRQSQQSGAKIINQPTDYPFGERQYTAQDIGGHRWTFSQSIADVDPSTWGGVLYE